MRFVYRGPSDPPTHVALQLADLAEGHQQVAGDTEFDVWVIFDQPVPVTGKPVLDLGQGGLLVLSSPAVTEPSPRPPEGGPADPELPELPLEPPAPFPMAPLESQPAVVIADDVIADQAADLQVRQLVERLLADVGAEDLRVWLRVSKELARLIGTQLDLPALDLPGDSQQTDP